MLQSSSFCTADKEKYATEPKQACSAWHAMRPPADSIAADGADQHGSKKDRGTCVRTRFASYTLGKHRSQVRAPGPATTHNHSRHKRLAPRTSAAADKASQRPTSPKAIKSTTRKPCFLGEHHEKNSRALRRARYKQNPKRIMEPASTNRHRAAPARRGAGRRPPREAHPTFLPPPEPLAWRPGQGGRQRGGGAPNNIPAAEAAQAPSSCSDSGSGDGEGPAAAKGELPRGQGPDHKHGNHPHSSGTTASQEDNTPGSNYDPAHLNIFGCWIRFVRSMV